MDIIKKIEQQYRQKPNYGIQFSIDANAFNCDITDDLICFDNGVHEMNCGTYRKVQTINIDDKPVGVLEEWKNGGLFEPICFSFEILIADCHDNDYEEKNAKYANNPHFFDQDESTWLAFATLQQFIDYLRKTNQIDI